MCGRYVQSARARAHARQLAILEHWKASAPRPETWNLAPTTASLVVRAHEEGLATDWMAWGLSDGSPAPLKPINARVETASSKAMFRDAWRSRRCVVPADGWYEWRLEHGRKQPYLFRRRDEEPLFFAGLWTGQTFCLLTTAADGDLAQIHDRRPLALALEPARVWMGEALLSPDVVVQARLPADEITFHPVSPRVSSPRNDGPDLVAEIKQAPPPPQPMQFDLFQNSA